MHSGHALWNSESCFRVSEKVNAHEYCIWDKENSLTFQEIPFHSTKVTVCCGFTAIFFDPFFFEETTRNGPVLGTVTARRFQNMIEIFVLPQIEGIQCLYSITCMQDGVPPHISYNLGTSFSLRSVALLIFKKSCLSRKAGNLQRF